MLSLPVSGGASFQGNPGHQATGDDLARQRVNSAWNTALCPSGTPTATPGTSSHPQLFGDMTSSLPVFSLSTSSQAQAQVSPTFVTPPNGSSRLARSAYPAPPLQQPPLAVLGLRRPQSQDPASSPAPSTPASSPRGEPRAARHASDAPQNPHPFPSKPAWPLPGCALGGSQASLEKGGNPQRAVTSWK